MPVSVDALYIATTVYKEARSEPLRCQVLVAEVVRNRMDAKNKTASQIVKERGQFSWMPLMKGRSIRTEYDRIQTRAKDADRKALKRATLIADKVLHSEYNTGNNLYYFHSVKGKKYDVKCGKLYFSHHHR